MSQRQRTDAGIFPRTTRLRENNNSTATRKRIDVSDSFSVSRFSISVCRRRQSAILYSGYVLAPDCGIMSGSSRFIASNCVFTYLITFFFSCAHCALAPHRLGHLRTGNRVLDGSFFWSRSELGKSTISSSASFSASRPCDGCVERALRLVLRRSRASLCSRWSRCISRRMSNA